MLNRVLLGGLLLLVGLVYYGVGQFGFVWDDAANIVQNPQFRPGSSGGLLFFWQHPFEDLYIPLTYTLWGIVAKMAALPTETIVPAVGGVIHNAGMFHYLNVLTHLVNIVLVWVLVRRISSNEWGALLGAAVFGLHPMQVEPVAWITGFKDLLSSMLALCALCLYLAFIHWRRPSEVEQADATRKPNLLLFAGAALLFILAVLAKPATVVLPLLAFCLSLANPNRTAKSQYGLLVIWGLISLAAVLITRSAQASRLTLEPLNPWERMAVAGDAICFYAGKVLWPTPLTIDYGHTPEHVLGGPGRFIYPLVLLAVAGVTVWLMKRRPRAGLPLAVFLLGLLPVLGFVPFAFQMYSTVADRYAYLSMMGVALGIGLGWQWLAMRKPVARVPVAAVGAVVCVLFAYLSTAQTEIWRSNYSLFEHAIATNEKSWVGNLYLTILVKAANEPENALKYADRAIELRPNAAPSRYMRAQILMDLKRYPEAADEFRRTVKIMPELHTVHYYLGNALFLTGDIKGAVAAYRESLRLRPDYAPAKESLQRMTSGLTPEQLDSTEGDGLRKP